MAIIEKANKNYTLGRGKLYFSLQDSDTALARKWLYIASTSEFNYNLEPEELEHVNADSGVRNVDDSVVLSRGLTGSIVTDDIQANNLALFFYGDATALDRAEAVVAGEALGMVSVNDIISLGASATNPQGHQNISNLAISTAAGARATGALTAGEDYDLRANPGLVSFKATVNGATNYFAHYTADAQVSGENIKRNRVLTGLSPKRGGLMFVQDNPKGINRKYTIPRAIIRANGDLSLKGDEWASIPLAFEAVDRGTGTELLYIDNLPE